MGGGAWKKKGLSRRRGEDRGQWGEMTDIIMCTYEGVKESMFKGLGNFLKREFEWKEIGLPGFGFLHEHVNPAGFSKHQSLGIKITL